MDIRRNYNGTIRYLNLIHFVEYACLVMVYNIEHTWNCTAVELYSDV